MSALEARGVTVEVGAARLLDSIDLRVDAGETVAIVGPNGAGKSTLLRVLAGEIVPRRGEVALKGRPLASYKAAALALNRAVLSQHIAVTFPFTAAEIVWMGAGDRRDAAAARFVEAALAEADVAHLRDRIVPTLSGGEQQRVQLARVLVQLACAAQAHGPPALLLDEPTASLDLRHQIMVARLARDRAAAGMAVVAVLHDLNLATVFAGRILVLDRGRVAADGAPAAILTDDLIGRVFGVASAVNRAPPPGVPFVLPQAMTEPDASSA
jgi:iron complex transport system ATP-binding protein